MANEFAQGFAAFSQMGNQAIAQAGQAMNNTMGLMNMSLRREQMELGRQAMEQRQQELIFEQGKQAANQKMDFYEKALSLSEAMGGAQGTRLRNVVLENISKDLGSPIEGGTVKDDQDYLALYKTTDPRHWGELDAMLRDERGPKESSALIPSLRQQAAIGNIQEAEIPIPEGFRGGINNMASLFRDGFYVDAETGEISGGHTQQAFGIGGSDTPQAMEKLPHETFMQVKDYVAAKDKQGALQRAIQQLGPEAQTKMADLIVKQQSGLPMTSKEEMEVNSYNQALDLMAVENRTPEQDEELDFHLRVNGHLDKMDRPTQMEQARIREIESRREKISHEVERIDAQRDLVEVQMHSVSQQTEFRDDKHVAEMKVLEKNLELADGKIAKQKAETAILDFRLKNLPIISQEEREEHALLIDMNKGRLAELQQKERKLRQQNESFPEMDRLEKKRLEMLIDVGNKQVEFYDAKISGDKERIKQSWDKLEMAKEKLPAEIAALDRRHRQLAKEDETLDANKQSIVKKRELDMKLKQDAAERETNLNIAVGEAITRGIINDQQAVTKMIDELGFRGQMSAGDITKEAKGGRTVIEANLNMPTAATRTASQSAQDQGQMALFVLDELEKTIKTNTVGAIGQLRSAVLGAGQQVSAFGQQLIQQRDEVALDIAANGYNIDTSRMYDPDVTEFELFSELAAYQIAAVGAGQSGRDLSDKDLKMIKRALGFDKKLTGPEQIKTAIAAARRLIKKRVDVADTRLGTKRSEPEAAASKMDALKDVQSFDDLMKLAPAFFGGE